MRFKVTYTVPFSPNPDLRTEVFEEEISCTDPKTARKKIYEKHPNASISSMVQISFF